MGGGGEFAELVDAELLTEFVEDLPRGAVGEAGFAEGGSDLGERPTVSEVGGGLQGGLQSSSPGQDDRNQIQVGGQGVAEVAAATVDPLGQPEIRPQEACQPQPDR